MICNRMPCFAPSCVICHLVIYFSKIRYAMGSSCVGGESWGGGGLGGSALAATQVEQTTGHKKGCCYTHAETTFVLRTMTCNCRPCFVPSFIICFSKIRHAKGSLRGGGGDGGGGGLGGSGPAAVQVEQITGHKKSCYHIYAVKINIHFVYMICNCTPCFVQSFKICYK